MNTRVLGLLTRDELLMKTLVGQLKEVFGNLIAIEPQYYVNNLAVAPFKAKTVLVSSLYVEEEGRKLNLFNNDVQIIYLERIIINPDNVKAVQALLKIETGTKIVIGTNNALVAEQLIKSFKDIGIEHLQFIPYYPNCPKLPNDVEIAVVFGHPHLAPPGMKQIIDMGMRFISMQTILEIIQKLDIKENNINVSFSKYIKAITGTVFDLIRSQDAFEHRGRILQRVIAMSNNGVLVLSEDKKILFNNEKVLELLDERKGNLDHIFSKYMPQINNIISNKNVIDSHEIINIKGQNYMISVNSVETEYVVVLSKTETIEKMERNVRQKLYGKEFNAKYTFNDIMTRSPQVNNLKEFAFKAAQTQYSIVIYGESGTGKELFAQAIHNASPRAGGPFVPANIAALQDNLIESELFGYEVGAFTGANKSGKPGIFEMAHNGTVFLDEIGELSLRLQSKLLRVLQEREVMRVGGTKIIPINVRIIAATNKNLHDMVSKGKFRSDLYYRLNVLPMTLIPLRDRISDIELLIEHFLSQVGMPIHCIPPDIMTRLKKHSWPGNIRELENLCNYISLMWDIYCNEKEIIKENIFGYIGKMESSDQTAAENVTFITQKLEQSGYLQEFISILTILKTAYKEQEIMSRSKLYNRLSPISRLSVQQIRERLKLLAEHGLVLSGNTKQGTRITEKGIKYLSESEIGVN